MLHFNVMLAVHTDSYSSVLISSHFDLRLAAGMLLMFISGSSCYIGNPPVYLFTSCSYISQLSFVIALITCFELGKSLS